MKQKYKMQCANYDFKAPQTPHAAHTRTKQRGAARSDTFQPNFITFIIIVIILYDKQFCCIGNRHRIAMYADGAERAYE